jgi:peptidyl-prolyl cis-trans isomerase B (cyclophilin B)
MPRLLALLFACLFVAGFAGCGDDEEDAPPAATATAEATPEDTGGEQTTGCEPAEQPAPKDVSLNKPKAKLDSAKTYVATVTTNCGSFEITLDAKRAPKTGGSFKHLVDKGFYDNLTFHRVSPGFVIQGGDPAGSGSGGPGYSIVEAPPEDLQYVKGVVAMAKTEIEEAGTSGSQFFVVTGDDPPPLPPDYALLGEVTKGQNVADLIGAVPVGPDERPVEPVVIESIKVTAS